MLNSIQRGEFVKVKHKTYLNEDGFNCPAALMKVYLRADWSVKGFKVW